VRPEAVIGLIASWSCPGLRKSGRPDRSMSAEEFKAIFDPATMSDDPVIFTSEDERWLLSHV
jgi:hypothetical protein